FALLSPSTKPYTKAYNSRTTFSDYSPSTRRPTIPIDLYSQLNFDTLAGPTVSPSHLSTQLPTIPAGQMAHVPAEDYKGNARKKYKCSACPRAFARAYNLKTHMAMHDPNRLKPHVCPHRPVVARSVVNTTLGVTSSASTVMSPNVRTPFAHLTTPWIRKSPSAWNRERAAGVTAAEKVRSKPVSSPASQTILERGLILWTLSIVNLATLQYNNDFWQSKFTRDELKGIRLEAKLHLVFSLMPSLSVSTCQFLIWIFTTEIPSVTRPISHFMGYFGTQNSLETQFAPALIFGLWRDAKRYPKAQQYIQEMTIPELALQDSDGIISSPLLRIRLKTLTIQQLRQMLHPEKLIEIFKERAPFTWNLLHTFCASPNAWRKWKSADEDEPMLDADEDWPDDPNDDLNLESGDPDPVDSAGHSWKNDYPGFSRNPVFVHI
ncbi:hypothetical protein K438DRAFT_2128783, partial [Mycena galopus ATCC 62051]